MIEYGEHLHTYGLIILGAIIIFGLGVMWGSTGEVSKNEHKNTN